MAESTPAPAHVNWRTALVDYGSLIGIFTAVLAIQATAFATLYGQLASTRELVVGQGEHLKSIDRQLEQVDKRLARFEDADRASVERDRQLLAFITERDREIVAALNELKLGVARIEAQRGEKR